jgi:hypothetical protein
MTIYTDQVTGTQYDRVPGGVKTLDGKEVTPYRPCRECAFNMDTYGCHRAVEHCYMRHSPAKQVFFIFKERK